MARLGLSETPIKIRVTGCPNGCARLFLAEIGLIGRAIGKYNLDLMLERYVAENKAAEGSGDFLASVGIVDGERTPEIFHKAYSA
ncbi:hypothetical protein [Vreelandella glaciei]|jgi:hypothetical protein|uniref:hypothetical protein n=1 Tax=Vreelandella glaciei TaxID=186761 RepID=UPI0030036DFA